MNEQASAWLSAVGELEEAHNRLIRVVMLQDDALKVIQQQDGPNTLFYLDPPYLHETRTAKDCYESEMSVLDHVRLLCLLADPASGIGWKQYGESWTDEEHQQLRDLHDIRLDGKFLLSGYHSMLYDMMRTCQGWTLHEKKIDNKASSATTKEIKTECLWCNF